MVGRRRRALALSGSALAVALLCSACARRDSASARSEAAREEDRRAPLPAAAPSAGNEASLAPARGDAGAGDDNEPQRAAPEALSGEALVSLEVPAFRPAIVSVPLGTRGPRPIAVAVHGNFDRPEWQCSVWRPIVAARGFVLCPRGVARRDVPKQMDRWEYASQAALAREIEAGVAALAARFGAHVDLGPILFIGFSLGAIYGAPMVQRAPARFPRVVLIEGGLGAWSTALAKRFAAAGGQRLLFACGQRDCMTRGKRLVAPFEKAGLPTRHGGDAHAGHTYDGQVAQVVADNWEWLVEGDPRWQAEGRADPGGAEQ